LICLNGRNETCTIASTISKRTFAQLIRCFRVPSNGKSPYPMIQHPLKLMRRDFQGRFLLRRDDAPANKAYVAAVKQIVRLMTWPAKSPDLSPINQVWALMKQPLRGRSFQDADSLSTAIRWEFLSAAKRNFWSSFRARCLVCSESAGRCPDRHWSEARKVHQVIERERS
jgi:transposase